jgi:hypothetical protein
MGDYIMVTFIKSWVWTGENSKKYFNGDITAKDELSKEIEQMLIKEKIAVEYKPAKTNAE